MQPTAESSLLPRQPGDQRGDGRVPGSGLPSPIPQTGTDYFDDDDGQFYEGAANRLRAAGLTVGCGIRRYCGEDRIGRDQMAAMLSRALSLPISGIDYFDDDDGSIFEGAINRIAQGGLTVGCNPPTNTHYCPENDVSRGEMAAFIKRAVDLLG
jgi:hypothetical protein